jgi:hypothetical protein
VSLHLVLLSQACLAQSDRPKRANLLSIWVFGPAVGRPAETEKVYASGHKRSEVNPTWDERSEEPQSLGTINLRTNTRKP